MLSQTLAEEDVTLSGRPRQIQTHRCVRERLFDCTVQYCFTIVERIFLCNARNGRIEHTIAAYELLETDLVREAARHQIDLNGIDDDYSYTKFSFKHRTHRLEHLQCTNLIDNDRFVKDICPLARVALDASVKIHARKTRCLKRILTIRRKKTGEDKKSDHMTIVAVSLGWPYRMKWGREFTSVLSKLSNRVWKSCVSVETGSSPFNKSFNDVGAIRKLMPRGTFSCE